MRAVGGEVWEGDRGECWGGGGGRVPGGYEGGGGDQVPPTSWVRGPGSLTDTPPLTKQIGHQWLGNFWQWVLKTSAGGVLRWSWGEAHSMGFVIHKGVGRSWGEVYSMGFMRYIGVRKGNNLENEGIQNFFCLGDSFSVVPHAQAYSVCTTSFTLLGAMRKSEVAQKWADWLRHPCRLGGPQ